MTPDSIQQHLHRARFELPRSRDVRRLRVVFRVREGGDWVKLANGRTLVQRRSTIGPFEVGTTDCVCGPVNVTADIRVHVGPAGRGVEQLEWSRDEAVPDVSQVRRRLRLSGLVGGGVRVPGSVSGGLCAC
ncbi:hypothetical protein [Kitasatospora sp. NPDC056184]|uniref:hypothetical protein n=1 Tax=Kitasatospora sp. NPDC056184 TaxID=3345738 RepID=UPI0035D82194